ncbi:MAG: sugar phosphate isomerase/epimerase [Spirochaetaceae bacterium]|nr:sugar phosphate isomerase/epimerase [Spirochaetaceae bacterium]
MQREWTLTVTGYSFTGKPVEEIRDICLAAKLSGIEGTPPLFQDMSDVEVESFRRIFEDAGLRIPTFHLPFSAADDIASFYNTQREAAVATMEQWMRRAALVGARIGIQHPTTTAYDVAREGLERYLDHIGRSFETLLSIAEELNFTIAIENMLPHNGGRFCSVPEHISGIIEQFDHPNLGFCLDTGHALISLADNAPEMQDAMGSKLVAYHLADNAGDRDSHLAPGHGRVDWSTVFRKATEANYSGAMCIETPPFSAGPNYSVEAWKGMVEDCRRLAEAGALPQ